MYRWLNSTRNLTEIYDKLTIIENKLSEIIYKLETPPITIPRPPKPTIDLDFQMELDEEIQRYRDRHNMGNLGDSYYN